MLGSFHDECLEIYQELLQAEMPLEFSEEAESYDFARCMRPDGTYYGTSGKCRKGTEAGPAPERKGTGAKGGDAAVAKARAEGMKGGALNKARAQGKKDAVAAARKAGGEKQSAGNARARMFRDELNKIKDQMKGKSPQEIAQMQREAYARAEKRAAAGEGKVQKIADKAKPKATTIADKAQAPMKAKRNLASTGEAKAAWKAASDNFKKAESEFKAAKKAAGRKPDAEAEENLRKLGAAADKAERLKQKAIDAFLRAQRREDRAKMTPSQRREERDWDKFKKKYG
jgi:hypothetical protein